MTDTIQAEVAQYYTEKLKAYGVSAKGVDWNGEESQLLRFKQILNLFSETSSLNGLSIADLGCGYGAFLSYLISQSNGGFEYTGYDISKDMCLAASRTHEHYSKADWIVSDRIQRASDFSVASGIFSVKLGFDDKEWFNYLTQTLENMNEFSRQGFAFNCLTSYSDKERMIDKLYYANPMTIFDYCKTKFSKEVAILHDYGLYEFTVIVRK